MDTLSALREPKCFLSCLVQVTLRYWCNVPSYHHCTLHSITCFVVIAGLGVNGCVLILESMVSHPSAHIMVCLLKHPNNACMLVSGDFPMRKLNFFDFRLCPPLLQKSGNMELEDKLWNTWPKTHGVKISLLSAACASVWSMTVFSSSWFQLVLCMQTPDRNLLPAFSCLWKA